MYLSPRHFKVADPAPVVVPGNARELLAKLDHAEQALVAGEISKLETIHELCLAYRAVDEDAFGEAAERLVFHGAHGTPGVAEYLSLEVSAAVGDQPRRGRVPDRAGTELCLPASGVVGRGPGRGGALVPGQRDHQRGQQCRVVPGRSARGRCADHAPAGEPAAGPGAAAAARADRARRPRRSPGAGDSRPGPTATSRCGTRAWSPGPAGT